jgi:uncharacterized membrane protein HdeD (DUF308 family)
MWNRNKIAGIALAVAGVICARIDVFFQVQKTLQFLLYAFGITLAFAGIAVYATGMKKKLTRLKACPFCFAPNELTAKTCKQCRKKLPEKEQA